MTETLQILGAAQWEVIRPFAMADPDFLAAIAARIESANDVIKPNAIYTREESLRLAKCGKDTLRKAELDGRLTRISPIGRRPKYKGAALLDFLENRAKPRRATATT